VSESDGLTEPRRAVYRTSSYSGGTNCVEVMNAADTGQVFVRHSREPDRPPLAFSAAEWRTFINAMRDGRFDAI